MKLARKIQDGIINTSLGFGGGCPICGRKNTLSNVGSLFKPCIECSACGSKFEQCSFGSPKYKLIEGNSEHLGKELTLKEWSLVRVSNLEGVNVQALKPNHVAITSEYSAEVTRDKVISIFKGLGFEVDRTGEEYYAHKGNFLTGFLIGFLVPKCDIYYSLSEAEGKTVINLRASVGFWKGGGALGMHKQETIFKKVVAELSADLKPVVEEHLGTGVDINEIPMGDRVAVEKNRVTGETTIARKIGAGVCMAVGLFIFCLSLALVADGISHNSAIATIAAILITAIGIGTTWFGWSYRKKDDILDVKARKIGVGICMVIGLLIILFGLGNFDYGMNHRGGIGQAIFGIFLIAIGIGIAWFGWSRRM